jgi:hypothetical protein
MKRKLFAVTLVLGVTVMASSSPRAEALGSCDAICDGPSNMLCACPPGSDYPGRLSNCNLWQGTSPHGCWLL